MMNAVISGRAGLALVIEGEALMSLDVDDLETLVPRCPSDLRFLLADATDLVTLEDTGSEEIAQRLDLEHDIACALDMTLIALDPDASMELRAEAVAALDELLANARVIERLEFTMYAKPLPDSADLMGALFCTELNTASARSFFERLDRDQTAIRVVREAWDALPDHLFGDEPAAKAVFHDAACNEGLFRLLALSYGDPAKVSAFLLEALRNRSISRLRNHREVVQQWCGPIRAAVVADAPVIESEYDDYEEATETPHSTGRDRRRRREPADVVLRKVESQKELIVAAMRERDLTRAREIIEELIDYQLKTGRPEHLAMSLCALAIKAKELGIQTLRELTTRSVEIRPDDGWAWAQRGEVQERLFSEKLQPIAGLDCSGVFRPALGVECDYYDVLLLPNDVIGIAIGDVSGKGITAALLIASLQAILRGQAIRGTSDLADMIRNVNRLVFDAAPATHYATLFYAQYEPQIRRLIYVNAGHQPPMILRRRDGEWEINRLEKGGTVLGLFSDVPYRQAAVGVQTGDVLLTFTDGIIETVNPENEEWGEEQLIETAKECEGLLASDAVALILQAADQFANGAKQHDDMTLMIARFL